VSASQRVQSEPAWLLHHRPFRDSSQILDVLSREYGRLSLVARGSRGAKSRLRGILRPFLPLNISWVIRSDLGTLTGAEMHGAPIALIGDGLMGGYYINELLLKLLHRHDPQPEIYAAYSATVAKLAGRDDVSLELRQFEMELLRVLGYALNLDHDTATRGPLDENKYYEYRVEQGPVPATVREGAVVYSGAELLAIRQQQFERPEILRCATQLLREVIAFHLGGKELKSRKVLLEMRRAAAGNVKKSSV
jgi:DNA repair protein RecO (recombination protein O)